MDKQVIKFLKKCKIQFDVEDQLMDSLYLEIYFFQKMYIMK